MTKIARPVYLAQLGQMVRPTSGVKSEDEPEQVRKLQVALDVAEELIRRKRAYGTELGKCLSHKQRALLRLTYGHSI